MDEKTLRELSRLLSEKLGRAIEITEAVPAGSGWHAQGFTLKLSDGSQLFAKRMHEKSLAFATPERKVASLLTSHSMGKRHSKEPLPIGVVLSAGDGFVALPEIDEDTIVYHIQEYGGEGESYWERLMTRREKSALDDTDRKEIDAVVDFLVKLHERRHPDMSNEMRTIVYNDSLRSELSNPELTLAILHTFPDAHPLLPPEKQNEYIGLMWNRIQAMKDRPERLVALHGDFWGGNVFFRPDGTLWVIDYSRIPWGDAGMDVGHWLSQYLRLYHETGNAYFKELGEYFLSTYEKATGDHTMRDNVALELGVLGVVYMSFFSNGPWSTLETETAFLDVVKHILTTGEFVWDIPA